MCPLRSLFVENAGCLVNVFRCRRLHHDWLGFPNLSSEG